MSATNAFEKLMQGARYTQGQKKRKAAATAAAAGQAKKKQQQDASSNQQAETTQQEDSEQLHAARVAAFKKLFHPSNTPKQKFQYLLVYDLEATTNQARTLQPVEIIELACVIVDTASAAIKGSFQAFVRPTEHPLLDPFCSQLTGISQAQVDAALLLAPVLQLHHEWLEQQGIFGPGITFLPATWTSWDLKVALCTECGWRRIQRPDYLCRWVDLKKLFYAQYKRRGNLKTCVEAAGLTWQGRAHSGIDDATNTANLAIRLVQQGTVFEVTESFETNPAPQQPSTAAAAAAHSNSSGGGSALRVTAPATAAVAGAAGFPPVITPSSSPSTAATGGSSKDCGSSPAAGRSSMQALAATKGAPGVFSQSGRWTGLCFCSVKAHARVTKKPGPNHGRKFFGCGSWRITQQSRSCGFFMWADDAPPGSTLPT